MKQFSKHAFVVISVTRLGDLFDFGQLIKLPKYSPFLGNFCKGVKINHFTSEIIWRFFLVTLVVINVYDILSILGT